MATLMDPQGLVQDNGKTLNEEICHILYHEKFAFCLLCKKDIREPCAVLPHLMGNDHRQHKNKLFSNCILDPFCDSSDFRFSEIVNNSKSDIAQLLHDADKPCYVYQMDANLVCLICQETISSAYDVDQMKNDLISHFSDKNESHFKKYRERISWVYYLNKSNNTFILFHKLLVYCSVCDKILEYDDNLMLYAAAGHLQTSQHKNNVGQVGEYNFVKSSSQSEHSTDDNRLNADVSIHKPESEVNKANNLICPDCSEPVEIINENSEFSMELHSQKHKNLSLVNAIAVSEYKENNEYPCPLCYEDITIYNKDVEISITRHFEEKHPNQKYQRGNANKEPDSLNFVSVLPKELASHRMYFDIDGNDVMCKLCSCALEDSSNDSKATEQAIIDHILKSYHMDQHKLLANKIMTNAVVGYNSKNRPRDPSDYDTLLSSKLVSKNSIVNKNQEYIQNNKTSYVCTLCQRSIAYSSNENSQLLNFLNHFNGERHTKRSRALIDNKTPDNKCDRSACSKSSAMRIDVENKVSDLSEDIHNTVKCQDVETHKLSDNVNVKKVSKDPCISPHMKYFKVDNSCFHCILCNVNINVSTKKMGKMLKDHILGSKHSKKYKQLLAHEVLLVNKNTGSSEKFNEQQQLLPHGSEEDTDQKAENLADNHNINNRKVDNEKVHYDMWLSNLVSKNSIVSINKEFIQKNERSYVCTLCQKRIPYCSNENSQLVGFLTHFYGGIHTKPFYTITHGKNPDSFKLNKYDGSACSKTSAAVKYVENKASDFSEDVNSTVKSQEVEGVEAYKLSDNVYMKKVAEDTCISPHMTYFKVDDCCFHCILCNVNIIVTAKKIKMLKDHILGYKHTKKYKLEQLKLAQEELFVNKNTDPSEKCKEQHQLLLLGTEEETDHTAENSADYQVKTKKLSDNVYNIKKLTEDPCIYPHIKFSEVDNSCFHCVLCNANIKAKSTEQMGKLIKEHVLGQKHTKKYKLDQHQLAHEESSVSINTYPSEKFVEQHQKQPHGCGEDTDQTANNFKGNPYHGCGEDTDQTADNFKGNPYVASYIKVENDKFFTCILCNVAIMDSGGKRLEHVLSPDHCLKLKALNESKKSIGNVSEKFTISPHIKFEAGNRFMCLLCNIPVIRTDKNKSLYGHILGSMHQQNLRLHVSGQN